MSMRPSVRIRNTRCSLQGLLLHRDDPLNKIWSSSLLATSGSYQLLLGAAVLGDRPAQTGAIDRVFPVIGVVLLFL